MSGIGDRVIRSVRERLQIGSHEVIEAGRGISWSPAGLRQRIWAEEPFEDDGYVLTRINVRTDALVGVSEAEDDYAKLATLMCQSTVSGAVIGIPDPGRLAFASTIIAHEETATDVAYVASVAATIQLAEAHILAPALAASLAGILALEPGSEAELAASGHPALHSIANAFAPAGEGPSRWAGQELEHLADTLPSPPCVLAHSDTTGLTAEFPFGKDTSLLTVRTDQRHPRMGSGALLLLRLPWRGSKNESARLALELNRRELTEITAHHFLGSWCLDPGGGVAFASFLPNLLHSPNVLTNLVFCMARRARWVAERVFGHNWEGDFQRSSEAVLHRAQRFLAAAEQARPDSFVSGLLAAVENFPLLADENVPLGTGIVAGSPCGAA